jgi:hypothetical protein
MTDEQRERYESLRATWQLIAKRAEALKKLEREAWENFQRYKQTLDH